MSSKPLTYARMMILAVRAHERAGKPAHPASSAVAAGKDSQMRPPSPGGYQPAISL